MLGLLLTFLLVLRLAVFVSAMLMSLSLLASSAMWMSLAALLKKVFFRFHTRNPARR